jgi:Domain of unknown function (DUF5658)
MDGGRESRDGRIPRGTAVNDGRAVGPAGAADVRRGDRRRSRARFVLRERRTGFERRRRTLSPAADLLESGLLHLRDRSATLLIVLIGANVLNLADFLMTLHALSSGVAEANPILRGLFDASPWAAGLFKLALVALLSVFIWCYRRFRLLLLTSVGLLGAFILVLVYQVYGLLVILR